MSEFDFNTKRLIKMSNWIRKIKKEGGSAHHPLNVNK